MTRSQTEIKPRDPLEVNIQCVELAVKHTRMEDPEVSLVQFGDFKTALKSNTENVWSNHDEFCEGKKGVIRSEDLALYIFVINRSPSAKSAIRENKASKVPCFLQIDIDEKSATAHAKASTDMTLLPRETSALVSVAPLDDNEVLVYFKYSQNEAASTESWVGRFLVYA